MKNKKENNDSSLVFWLIVMFIIGISIALVVYTACMITSAVSIYVTDMSNKEDAVNDCVDACAIKCNKEGLIVKYQQTRELCQSAENLKIKTKQNITINCICLPRGY